MSWAEKSALLKNFYNRISLFRMHRGTKESLETRLRRLSKQHNDIKLKRI